MICYYHNDLDGRCSAAIALRAHKNGRTCELAYGRTIPTDDIAPGEPVVIVDFTMPQKTMAKILKRTRNITWIDHHQSALRVKYPIKPAGILAMDKAACQLTWEYYHPGRPLPEAVILTADKDIWAWRHGLRTARFNEGMRIRDAKPESTLWNRLLKNDKRLLAKILEQGTTCLQFRNALCADYVKQFGFETNFHGLRCAAVALQYFGSDTFGPLADVYDVCITFAYTGAGWAVSLFSREVNVGLLAEKHGGGGHRLAAGFICEKLPFRKTGPISLPLTGQATGN